VAYGKGLVCVLFAVRFGWKLRNYWHAGIQAGILGMGDLEMDQQLAAFGILCITGQLHR